MKKDHNHYPKDSRIIVDSVICSKEVQKIAEVETFSDFLRGDIVKIDVVVHEDDISQNIIVIKDKIVSIGVVPVTINFSGTFAGSPFSLQEGIPFQEETECLGVCPEDTVTESPLQVEVAIAQSIRYNLSDIPDLERLLFIIKVILRTTVTATRQVVKSKDRCLIDLNENRCKAQIPSSIQPPDLFGGETTFLLG